MTLIVQMGNNWLKGSTASIEQLPEGLSQDVRYLLGDEAGSVIKKVKESIIPLTSPTAVPWTCDRCGKTYKGKLKSAKAHGVNMGFRTTFLYMKVAFIVDNTHIYVLLRPFRRQRNKIRQTSYSPIYLLL